jgi:hypothetical protein
LPQVLKPKSLLPMTLGGGTHVSDTTNHPNDAPTAEAPEVGVIGIVVDRKQIPISQVEHWIEDGMHVFRSMEFDCIAMNEHMGKVLEAFIDTAEDVYRFLDDLVDAERATQDEIKTLAMLSRRFYDVYSAQAQALRRRIEVISSDGKPSARTLQVNTGRDPPPKAGLRDIAHRLTLTRTT